MVVVQAPTVPPVCAAANSWSDSSNSWDVNSAEAPLALRSQRWPSSPSWESSISIYLSTFVYKYTLVYICVFSCIYMHAYMYICTVMYIKIDVLVCVSLHSELTYPILICVRVCMQTYRYIYTYT